MLGAIRSLYPELVDLSTGCFQDVEVMSPPALGSAALCFSSSEGGLIGCHHSLGSLICGIFAWDNGVNLWPGIEEGWLFFLDHLLWFGGNI